MSEKTKQKKRTTAPKVRGVANHASQTGRSKEPPPFQVAATPAGISSPVTQFSPATEDEKPKWKQALDFAKAFNDSFKATNNLNKAFSPSSSQSNESGPASGSAAHLRSKFQGKGGGRPSIGNMIKTGMRLSKGVANDLQKGKNPGKGLSKNLGAYIGSMVQGDMFASAGLGATKNFSGKAYAVNNFAKKVGVPNEVTTAASDSLSAVSPVSTTLSEGGGAWFSLLESGAGLATGDKNWLDPLEKHNESGTKTATPFQPVYWMGQIAEGKSASLAKRLISKEAENGEMGSFVQAGNYWGDAALGDRNLKHDMKEVVNGVWEGASGEGGIKGAHKAGVKKVEEAQDYWSDVMVGKRSYGRDAKELVSFAWSGVDGEGGMKGAHDSLTTDLSDHWKDAFKPDRDQSEKVNNDLYNKLKRKNGGANPQGLEDDWSRANYQYSSSKVKENRDVRMGQLLKETYGHDKKLYQYAQMKYHWQKKNDLERKLYVANIKMGLAKKYGADSTEFAKEFQTFQHHLKTLALPKL